MSDWINFISHLLHREHGLDLLFNFLFHFHYLSHFLLFAQQLIHFLGQFLLKVMRVRTWLGLDWESRQVFDELQLNGFGGLFWWVFECVFIFEGINKGMVFVDEFGFGGMSEEELFLLLQVFVEVWLDLFFDEPELLETFFLLLFFLSHFLFFFFALFLPLLQSEVLL